MCRAIVKLGESFETFKYIRAVPSCDPTVTSRNWWIRNMVSQAHTIFFGHGKEPVKQIYDPFINLINGYFASYGIRFITL